MQNTTKAYLLLAVFALRLGTFIVLLISLCGANSGKFATLEIDSTGNNLSVYAIATLVLTAILGLIDILASIGCIRKIRILQLIWFAGYSINLVAFGLGIAITYALDLHEPTNALTAVFFEFLLIISTGVMPVLYGSIKKLSSK